MKTAYSRTVGRWTSIVLLTLLAAVLLLGTTGALFVFAMTESLR